MKLIEIFFNQQRKSVRNSELLVTDELVFERFIKAMDDSSWSLFRGIASYIDESQYQTVIRIVLKHLNIQSNERKYFIDLLKTILPYLKDIAFFWIGFVSYDEGPADECTKRNSAWISSESYVVHRMPGMAEDPGEMG
jgi:hypothetical protein